VEAKRVHGGVVGDGIDGVAVQLEHHAISGIGDEVDERRLIRLPQNSHAQVLDVPCGNRRGIGHVVRDVLEVQYRHSSSIFSRGASLRSRLSFDRQRRRFMR
jgi:hypothetical protein